MKGFFCTFETWRKRVSLNNDVSEQNSEGDRLEPTKKIDVFHKKPKKNPNY